MVNFNRLLSDRNNAKLLREKREMATKNNAAAVEEDESLPEEFADDPAVTVPHTPSAGSHYGPGSLSSDDLDEKTVDNARDEEERLKLNPPTGDWKKEDSWEYEKQVNGDDQAMGDQDPAGRTFMSFRGKPVAREANGMSYEPSLRLRISPDKRYKQDKPGEIDLAYKLYLQAKDMYLEKHSEAMTKLGQLRSMLQHDAYFLRTMNGDNGPVITNVKLKSYQGGNRSNNR